MFASNIRNGGAGEGRDDHRADKPLTQLSDAVAAAVDKAAPAIVTVRAHRRVPSSGIVWNADGVIVTAAHTIETEDEISVAIGQGREHGVTLLGYDAGSALAVLRADGGDLTPASGAMAEASGQESGLLVMNVGKNSGAARAGLLVSDIMVRIGDAALHDTGDIFDALGPDSVEREEPAEEEDAHGVMVVGKRMRRGRRHGPRR